MGYIGTPLPPLAGPDNDRDDDDDDDDDNTNFENDVKYYANYLK